MADAFYTTGLAELNSGVVNWVADEIRVGLVSAMAYKFNAAHLFADALGTGLLGFGTLVNRTSVGGIVGSTGTTTITAALSQQTAHALVTYKWSVALATSRLLSYHDSVIGLPAAPDGGPFTLVVPHGTNRLFDYVTQQFGVWEGLRGSFQSAIVTPPCEGSVSRSMAF